MKSCRRVIAVVFALLLSTLSLSSCSKETTDGVLNTVTLGLWNRIGLRESERDVVEKIDENTARYQGNTYYLSPICMEVDMLSVQEKYGYEYIGWSGNRFFYITTYYVDNKEAPEIIRTNRKETYFIETYDYKTDLFEIEGMDEVICFGENFIQPSAELPFYMYRYSIHDIILQATTYESVSVRFGISSHDGVWYACPTNSKYTCFELTENFIEILTEKGIIT